MREFRSVTAGALIIAASAIYVACVGDDPSTSSGTTSSSDGGDGGSDAATESGLAGDAAPSLGCPLGCLPPAPSGWSGPSAVYDGPPSTKPAECPATYTQKELEAFQGLDAGAAACACGAATNAGAVCTSVVKSFPMTGCTPSSSGLLEGTFSVSATSKTCLTQVDDGFLLVEPATIDSGTCSYPSPTTTLPDAGFAAQEVSCGLPQNAACASSSACVATPIPDAPFTRICIHKDGDTPCPSADYSQRVVASQSITDSRSCSACVGTATGGTCGNSVGYSDTIPDCVATSPTGMTAGTCFTNESFATAVVGGNIAPSGMACVTAGGTPQGTAVPADPVTFCCNK